MSDSRKKTGVPAFPEEDCNMDGQAVKLNHILVDSLSIFHGQISEFMLHISNWIMWTKVHLEFQDKLCIVIYSEGMEDRGGVGL